MRNTWKIARWEVLRNVTNKQFIIGLILTPILIVVFSAIPILLELWNQPSLSTYYVIDEVEALNDLQALLPDNIHLEKAEDPASIETTVKSTKANGYFHLTPEFFTTGQLDLMYNNRNSGSLGAIERALTTLLQQVRLSLSQISSEQLSFVTASANVQQVAMEKELKPDAQQMIVSVVFAFLIFFLIFRSSAMLMQSALQEKRDRMAEIVLSSVRPAQLMQGKIIGHFILGLIQLGFWLALGLPIAAMFLNYPILEALAGVNLSLILFFGLGGYLLFASLFISIGATMSDLQSANNLQGLVVLLPASSFLFIAPVTSNPDGAVSIFGSLFPFTSPAVMMLRNGLTVIPLWQIVTSATILLVTIYLTVSLGAKIFRIGMLMYGKNATTKEIIKWIRYKEI